MGVRLVKDAVYWPLMNQEITDYVSQCSVCNMHRPEQCKEPMVLHDFPGRPWRELMLTCSSCRTALPTVGRLFLHFLFRADVTKFEYANEVCGRCNDVTVCASWSARTGDVGQWSTVLLRRVQSVRAEMGLRAYHEQSEISPEQRAS